MADPQIGGQVDQILNMDFLSGKVVHFCASLQEIGCRNFFGVAMMLCFSIVSVVKPTNAL